MGVLNYKSIVFSIPKANVARIVILIAALISLAACGPDIPSSAPEAQTTNASDVDTISSPTLESPSEAPATPTATPVPTPEPLFDGFDFQIETGDFWVYRWSSEDQSCAQGRGCSTDKESGVFRIELGSQRNVQRVNAFEMIITGDLGPNSPPWRYIAVHDMKILASKDGSHFVVLFDGQTGVWAGSGFFDTRFEDKELSSASQGFITESDVIAEWDGVHIGSAIVVGRADSQSECEIIAGLRICPRQESYSFTEREWFRPGVGAVGYNYRISSSFSGGGFFSSHTSEENVALVASSLRGDADVELQSRSQELEDFVEEFLTGAVAAEIATYENNDDSYISLFMTGAPLRHVKANLESLSAQGMVFVPAFDPNKSKTADIREITNGRLEVDRCEFWSGSYFAQSDRALVSTDPVELVPQTITLEFLPDGWFITSIEFYDDSSFC